MLSISIRKRLGIRALIAMIFNAVIASVITAFGNDGFAVNLLYSQLIGMSIWALIDGGRHVIHPAGHMVLMRSKTEREQAQRQATEAQLKLQQSQLDPHMLLNTLANLRALIPQEPDRAVQMLALHHDSAP